MTFNAIKHKLAIFYSSAIVITLLSSCSLFQWPGPGSDLSKSAQEGGYRNKEGAHFGGWANNAWGEDSHILPFKKSHPPLAGVSVCLLEHPDFPCAISNHDGRFDLYGLPDSANDNLHLDISIAGYYSILMPYHPYSHVFDNHPAVEMPSLVIAEEMFDRLSIQPHADKGSISFMFVDSVLEANPKAKDHEEINTTLAGVAVSYRAIQFNHDGSVSTGEWSNPQGWNKGNQDVAYLDNKESPSKSSNNSSASGLAIAVNLKPGWYEIKADDTNKKTGFGYQASDYHWQCIAMPGSPSQWHAEEKTSTAITQVIAGHISDVRFLCMKDF